MAFMNKWEIALEDNTKALKECQELKGLKSCLGCDEVSNCDIRDFYVKAVYESMSKDEGGGFEF
jgi:hypothetical protein